MNVKDKMTLTFLDNVVHRGGGVRFQRRAASCLQQETSVKRAFPPKTGMGFTYIVAYWYARAKPFDLPFIGVALKLSSLES